MTGRTIGKQAVIIGAGMSGLAAAGALADYFERVLILDSGYCCQVGQCRGPARRNPDILHVLLPGAQRALSDKIAADPDGGMTATFAGSNETIRADLIVDASGRAAPTLSQLRSTGHPLPEEVSRH